MNRKVLLVGAGPMSEAYVQVMRRLNLTWDVVSRSATGLNRFSAAVGEFPGQRFSGGIESLLSTGTLSMADYSHAIVSVGVVELASVTRALAQSGARSILVEKPAGLTVGEIKSLNEQIQKLPTEVFVAYNRRFYPAVQEAKRRIQAEGGARIVHFEFSEWSHKIEPLVKAPQIKENWFLANSSHVVDLAFYLAGGWPSSLHASVSGQLSWHPSASAFVGSGVTQSNALFSYFADWTGPGRWAVEVTTAANRYILKPLESLQVIAIGSVQAQPVTLTAKHPDLKEGLLEQVDCFISDGRSNSALSTLAEHASHLKTYAQMLGVSENG